MFPLFSIKVLQLGCILVLALLCHVLSQIQLGLRLRQNEWSSVLLMLQEYSSGLRTTSSLRPETAFKCYFTMFLQNGSDNVQSIIIRIYVEYIRITETTFSTSDFVALMSLSSLSQIICDFSASLHSLSNFFLLCEIHTEKETHKLMGSPNRHETFCEHQQSFQHKNCQDLIQQQHKYR